MFATSEVYFSIIRSANHCQSSSLAEMHNLEPEETDLHVLGFRRFPLYSGVTPEMPLRSVRDLEVIRTHPKLLPAKLYNPRVKGSRVT